LIPVFNSIAENNQVFFITQLKMYRKSNFLSISGNKKTNGNTNKKNTYKELSRLLLITKILKNESKLKLLSTFKGRKNHPWQKIIFWVKNWHDFEIFFG
jgi:hypothetical protein